jgi:hypothetical protein
MLKVLKSLKYDEHIPPDSPINQLDRGRKTSLPIRSPHAIAAVLSQYVRSLSSSQVKSYSFTMSEKKALLAVKHLTALVKGDSDTIRKLVLKYSSTKPSKWTNDEVTALLSALGVPTDKLNVSNGLELLNIDTKTMAETYAIPSILQFRFSLYQNTLVLLESWWNQGRRPKDVCEEEPYASQSQQQSNLKEGMLVEISDAASLLSAYIPLNRGYGWGMSLDALTALAEHVGGALAVVTPHRDSRLGFAACRLVSFSSYDFHQKRLENQTVATYLSAVTSLPADGDNLFVPTSCIKKPSANAVQLGLTADDIALGNLVKLPSAEVLQRAFEEFEWWDRPPSKVSSSYCSTNSTLVCNRIDSDAFVIGASRRGWLQR